MTILGHVGELHIESTFYTGRLTINHLNLQNALQAVKEEYLTNARKKQIEEVTIQKYGSLFNPNNLERLTAEGFRSFLLYRNNGHWYPLHRYGRFITADMKSLRKALAFLLDESIPIAKRLDETLPGGSLAIRKLGKAVLTPILLVVYPKRYCVYNETTKRALKLVRMHPDRAGQSFGEAYEIINEKIKKLATDNNLTLWEIDVVWAKVVDKKSMPQYKAEQKFAFLPQDFKLCTGKRKDAERLRNTRFLLLYRQLTSRLSSDPDLRVFVSNRKKQHNGLTTISPYVPNYTMRGGGYKNKIWIGFADTKYKEPRKGIQFQYGIDASGSAFYGIWIEGGQVLRELHKALTIDPASLNLYTLKSLSGGYWLRAEVYRDHSLIINSRLEDISERMFTKFTESLKHSKHIHLGRRLTVDELVKVNENIIDDMVKTTHDLLQIYRWWVGLAPRERTEDEVFGILKQGDPAIVSKIFTDVRLGTASQRIGQGAVRRHALERYSNCCALCDIKETRILVASHIIPWADDKENRGNPSNVLCLCVAHDKLFENGLIGIKDNFEVEFAPRFLEWCDKSKMCDALKANTKSHLRMPSYGIPDTGLLRKHRVKLQLKC